MDRRAALKNLTMSMGYVFATPSLLSVLSSCTTEKVLWKPLFLSAEEQKIVTELIDIIIPETDIVGAVAVNIPQFLDLMYKDIEEETKQKVFKNGAKVFAASFKEKFGVSVMHGKKQEFELLLTQYFDLSKPETKEVLQFQNSPMHKVQRDQIHRYNLYNFLLSVRYYAIFGYCTSEKVGEEILSYDPIPGEYKGCISVEEVGNVWSL